MSLTAQELIDNSNRLITERVEWDLVWSDCARLVLPLQSRTFNRGTANATRETLEGWAAGPKSVDRYGDRFDITGLVAIDRLATGLMSLATPDNEKWEDIGVADPVGSYEMNDAEVRWAERQRDFLLNTRYNALTGWVNAHGAAMRSMCVFGTGLYAIQEAFGRRGVDDVRVPYTFTHLPLGENYLTVDGQGAHDQNYRRWRMSARAAYSRYGEALSVKAKEKATDPKKWHEMIELLHWVGYRQTKGAAGDPMRNSLVESVHVEVETKHEIRRGGFTYWPVIAYQWNAVDNSPYAEGPVLLVLAEIKSANVLGKNTLLSAQQLTRPPVATMDNNTPRPNLNPSAINYGQLDAQGRLKIQPILTAQNPSLVREVQEASRQAIREGLYTNLWQALINNPQMTATQSLIVANEKGELLGPVGTRIQHGLTKLTDAELTILEGKGAWAPGGLLEPPDTLAGRDLRPRFKSPLDRMRRASELVGIQRTLEVLLPLSQVRPGVLDKIDEDAIADIAQEVTGAPRKMYKTDERLAKTREQSSQMAQIETGIGLAGAAGAAAEKAIPAAQAASGMLQQMADAPA